MRTKQLLWGVLLSVITLASCKKSDPISSGNSIQGAYKGKYGIGNAVPAFYVSFTIKSGNEIEFKGIDPANPTIGSGGWILNGNDFKTTIYFNGGSNSFEATFDSKTGHLEGTWGDNDKYSGAGTFYVDKE